MKIAVAGTGYVGLVTAVCLAEHGHAVTCVDVDRAKVEKLWDGVSPIYEPGLDQLMEKNKQRLCYTTDYAAAYGDAEIIFIGVGTPEKKDGSANLSYVFEVAQQIAETVKRDCVVVVKSTVPIGTNERVEQVLRDKLQADVHVHVASNPEFLAQGTAVRDTLHASRIVIGAEDDYAAAQLKKVYQEFDAPLLVTNRRSAEMIKYASNDFLALKLSYINEIANLCEIVGADIGDVSKGMGLDSRIGPRFLNAGIGYGGSCFPKDTKALHWLANYYDHELKTIKAAIEVNENQKIKLLKKSRKYYESLQGLTVAILGLTFKPETDDLREAPSLVNLPIMLEDGAAVRVWDPVAAEKVYALYPEITCCNTPQEALEAADLCFIFTEWEQVRNLKPVDYVRKMRRPIILDGRNCYSLASMRNQGLIYESIGRGVAE